MTTFLLALRGLNFFGIPSQVFRPMTTALVLPGGAEEVTWAKYLSSDLRCQGSVLDRPMPLEVVAATMRVSGSGARWCGEGHGQLELRVQHQMKKRTVMSASSDGGMARGVTGPRLGRMVAGCDEEAEDALSDEGRSRSKFAAEPRWHPLRSLQANS